MYKYRRMDKYRYTFADKLKLFGVTNLWMQKRNSYSSKPRMIYVD